MRITPYLQTQLVIWINQIAFFLLLALNFSWTYVVTAIFMLYIFAFISESTVHRYFTHKSYSVNPLVEKFFLFFAFLVGQGPILSWVTVHRSHHAFEDTEKDPHSPLHKNWLKIYFAFLPKEYNNRLIFDLLRSKNKKYLVFENNYYVYMWIFLLIATYLINPFLMYMLVSGSAMWYLATILVNIGAHYGIGKKRYANVPAYNSKLINFLTGVGYHNNHHKQPKSHTYSHDKKEIDLYGWIIEKIFL